MAQRLATREGDRAARARARLPHAVQADLQSPVAMARRRSSGARRQRQVSAAARDRRDDRGAAGEGLVFTQFREITARACGASRIRLRSAGLVLARRHAGRRAAHARDAISGGRGDAVLRAVAQGRRHRPQSHGRVACHTLRPLVESGGRGPGDRSGVSDRSDANRCSSTSSCAAARSKRRSTC